MQAVSPPPTKGPRALLWPGTMGSKGVAAKARPCRPPREQKITQYNWKADFEGSHRGERGWKLLEASPQAGHTQLLLEEEAPLAGPETQAP